MVCNSFLQTRLPTDLANSLQATMTEYEEDLALTLSSGEASNSESDEVQQMVQWPQFPSAHILSTLKTAIRVRHSHRAGAVWLGSTWPGWVALEKFQ